MRFILNPNTNLVELEKTLRKIAEKYLRQLFFLCKTKLTWLWEMVDFLFFFFWPHPTGCRILVPQSRDRTSVTLQWKCGVLTTRIPDFFKFKNIMSYFTFTFHFYALEKEMATHSSVLAWRIPGMGSYKVGHDWSDLAAAAVANVEHFNLWSSLIFSNFGLLWGCYYRFYNNSNVRYIRINRL